MIFYYIFGSLSPIISLVVLFFFIKLIFSNRSLLRRMKAVEEQLKTGKFVTSVKPEAVNMNTAQPASFISSIKEEPKISEPFTSAINQDNLPKEKDAGQRFAEWLKEDWLMKLGAFLFIVGFGWFVSYAFAQNWIGPIGRITFGVLVGIIIMALGFWRMTKYKSQGAVFMALGAGMAMLTIFAGRSIYGFFTPASAIALDFIICAFVSFASYRFNVKALAFIAQILAFVTPLLSAGQTNDSFFLFSYLFFVSLATLLLAGMTGWRNLISTSLIFVGFYSFPYIFSAGSYSGYGSNIYARDASLILNFAYLFGILYLLSGMFAVIKRGVQDFKNEIVLAVLNGLFLFMWIYNVAANDLHSMIYAVWAVVFVISSFFAFKFSAQLEPFYAYGAVAVAFIAAATAAQLSGSALVIAFTVEVFLLVLSVLSLTRNFRVASSASWLFIAPVVLSLASISQYADSRELFTKDFFALILLAVALVFAGRLIASSVPLENQTAEKKENNAGPALIVFGILYLMYILWQFMHIVMIGAPDMATMTTLLIYTIFGVTAYFSGLRGNDMARKTYGVVMLAFVVVRLILVDVWQMALFGRVITFLAIGVLLMSTAFLTKRNKNV